MSVRSLLDDIVPVPDPLQRIRVQDARIPGQLLLGSTPIDVEEAINALTVAAEADAPVAYQPPGGSAYFTQAIGSVLSNGFQTQAANSRFVLSGVSAGIRYIDIAAAVPTVLVATPTAGLLSGQYTTGYDGAGLIIARAFSGPECWRSVDNGVTYTSVPGILTTGRGAPVWDPVAGWFIQAVLAPGFAIETSSDGLLWTPRATPPGLTTSAVQTDGAGNCIAVSLANGPLFSSDSGVSWAAAAGGVASELVAIGENISVIVPFAAGDWYVSLDKGASWTLALGSNTAARPCSQLSYISAFRRFYSCCVEGSGGACYMNTLLDAVSPVYRPTGSFVLGGLTAVLGGTRIFDFDYDVASERFVMSGNAGGLNCWYSTSQTQNLVATAGAAADGGAIVSCNALVAQLRSAPPSVIPSGGTLWYGATGQLYSRSGLDSSYRIGPTAALRFDGTLSATLFVDFLGTWTWEPVSRQLRLTPAASNYYGGTTNTTVGSEIYSGAGAVTTRTFTSANLNAGVPVYVASMSVAVDATFNGTSATATRVSILLAAGPGIVVATAPMYDIRLLLAANGSQGSISVVRSGRG